jgi:deoxyadenosine/deoxycytidine kinase
MSSTKVFSIEGNIGTGKSTFLEKLKTHYSGNSRICFLDEPIDVWSSITDTKGINILEKYYENQEKYAFSFQMMAFISRLSALKNALKGNYNIIIMERSLYTDCNVFAKMLYDDNKIEEIQYSIYKKWFNDFIKELPMISFIYLKTEPLISAKRVAVRNRQGEIIPLAYLENCNKYHDEWLMNNNTLPLLVLDANIDINQEPEIINTWINKIEHFIWKHKPANKWMSIIDWTYYIQDRLF